MNDICVFVTSIFLFQACNQPATPNSNQFFGNWKIEKALIDSLNEQRYSQYQFHYDLLLNFDGSFVVPIHTDGVYKHEIGNWNLLIKDQVQYIHFESSNELFKDTFEVTNMEIMRGNSIHVSKLIGFRLKSKHLILELTN